MNLKFPALVTVFLLASGCATLEPEGNSSTAGQTASGAPAGRTRAEVHAEAVETVKHYKATVQQELEYFD